MHENWGNFRKLRKCHIFGKCAQLFRKFPEISGNYRNLSKFIDFRTLWPGNALKDTGLSTGHRREFRPFRIEIPSYGSALPILGGVRHTKSKIRRGHLRSAPTEISILTDFDNPNFPPIAPQEKCRKSGKKCVSVDVFGTFSIKCPGNIDKFHRFSTPRPESAPEPRNSW